CGSLWMPEKFYVGGGAGFGWWGGCFFCLWCGFWFLCGWFWVLWLVVGVLGGFGVVGVGVVGGVVLVGVGVVFVFLCRFGLGGLGWCWWVWLWVLGWLRLVVAVFLVLVCVGVCGFLVDVWVVSRFLWDLSLGEQ
ncbi:hypothetical protein RA267_27790, partial [Pseudomonas syringae pv. tagetis]|uniref:hypothetical protein n=1 Tax=Pseudomonas syringae group genomosp. 7 TaxID=251699 RepID=UPI00376FFA6B